MMRRIRKYLKSTDGAGLLEYAFIFPLFLFFLLAVIEFSLIYFQWIMAEKATTHAARIAAMRPAMCPGLATVNNRLDPNGTDDFGSICKRPDGTSICGQPATITCAGALGDPTFAEIFTDIGPLLPVGAAAANLQITYESSGLGFLGGPFIPIVSVQLSNLQVSYITPFAGLLALYSAGAGGGFGAPLTLPPMRATVSGEDLAHGS